MKVFKSQSCHPQHTISINKGKVFVDGEFTYSRREEALGFIVLRLNARVIELEVEVANLKESHNPS